MFRLSMPLQRFPKKGFDTVQMTGKRVFGAECLALRAQLRIEPFDTGIEQFGTLDQFKQARGKRRSPGKPGRTGNFLGHKAVFLRTRSEEHTSELQSLMRISYAVFRLKKKKK